MTYRTRQILRTTLPIAIWLLAVVGIYCFYRFSPNTHWEGAVVVLVIPFLLRSHADLHARYDKESFLATLVMGIASYWIPTILLVVPLFWIFMARYYTFLFKDLLASLLALMTVAIHAIVLVRLGWCANHWACFFCPYLLWGWIPVLLLYFATKSTKIIQNLLKMR